MKIGNPQAYNLDIEGWSPPVYVQGEDMDGFGVSYDMTPPGYHHLTPELHPRQFWFSRHYQSVQSIGRSNWSYRLDPAEWLSENYYASRVPLSVKSIWIINPRTGAFIHALSRRALKIYLTGEFATEVARLYQSSFPDIQCHIETIVPTAVDLIYMQPCFDRISYPPNLAQTTQMYKKSFGAKTIMVRGLRKINGSPLY